MTISRLTFFCGIYVVVALLIITGKGETTTQGFHALPRSRSDALALAFHLLELGVAGYLLGFFFLSIDLHPWALPLPGLIFTNAVPCLLIVMSFLFWNRDRQLAQAGLWLGIPGTVLVLLLVATIVKG